MFFIQCLDDEQTDDIQDFNGVAELLSILLQSVTTLVKQSTDGFSFLTIVSLPNSIFSILEKFYNRFPVNQPNRFEEQISSNLRQNANRLQTLLLMLLTADTSFNQGDHLNNGK